VGPLELTRAPRTGRSANPTHQTPRRLAIAIAGVALAATVLAPAVAAEGRMRPTDLRCLEGCAGKQTAAVGSLIRITGSGLKHVTEVRFRGRSRRIPARPTASGRHRVVVEVPRGARSGHPKLRARDGNAARMRSLLRVVPPRRLPGRGSFELLDSRVRPQSAFVDSGRAFRLRYRFRSYGRVNVTVKLVHAGRVVRRWTRRDQPPYKAERLTWRGMLGGHRLAPSGRYRFKLKAPGHRPRTARRVRLLGGKFPIRGQHGYGGAVQRFGAPRSGGRVHEGQDVFAPCGTRVVAARGGRVEARGSDPELYGNWIVIDARGTRTDYRYAHFRSPASVGDGERVRTGDRVGRIGRTGNARSVGCMLHFEIWPHGWENRGPKDPLPILRRWDGWS
jgi:murein DD-endopeptidase MepM/ murein hydrolase activator NlpD